MTVEARNERGYSYPELHPGCTACHACAVICPDFVFQVWRYDEPLIHDLDADTHRDALQRGMLRYCPVRSEEHTSELQSLMRISYAVFCLKKQTTNSKRRHNTNTNIHTQQLIQNHTPSYT